MAQPARRASGVPARYRIYLASSPLLCLADALSIAIQVAALSISLGTTPRKASQLVVLVRSEPRSQAPIAESGVPSQSWPRWLFFVMGPLPAAIKLGSFRGTPWSKTCGMMFVASFIVTEVFNALSHLSPSLGAVVARDADVSSMEQAELQILLLRYRQLNDYYCCLDRHIVTVEKFIYGIGLISHVLLIVWTGNSLRLLIPALETFSLDAARLLGWILVIAILSVSSLFALALIAYLVLCFSGRLRSDRKSITGRILSKVSNALMVLSVLAPDVQDSHRKSNKDALRILPPPMWFGEVRAVVQPWLYLFCLYYLFYRVLNRVCGQWPVLGRALLVDQRSVITVPNEAVDETLESVGDAVIEKTKSVEVAAFYTLCFFFTNLAVCVLWYLFLYDETGTLNPDWTDIFG